MIHFRDDKLIGEKLNKHFDRPNIDFTLCECWQTGNTYWGLHSYINYENNNLLSRLGVEITIINDGGHISRRVVKCICSEIFSRYDRLTALISPENKQALKFVRIVGFTYEGRLRKVDKGKDTNIFSLFNEEYKEKWEQS